MVSGFPAPSWISRGSRLCGAGRKSSARDAVFPQEGTKKPPRQSWSELRCAALSWVLLLYPCFSSSLAQLLKLLSRPPEQTWIRRRTVSLPQAKASCVLPRGCLRESSGAQHPSRGHLGSPSISAAGKLPPPTAPGALGKFLSGQGQDTSAGLCEGSRCIN